MAYAYGFEDGMPNSWDALARAQKGQQSFRGSPANRGSNPVRKPSRGSSYTAEQALVDSPWVCKICEMKVTGPINLTDHMLGTKHKMVVDNYLKSGAAIPADHLFCELCKISTTNYDNLMSHLTGQKHQSNLQNFGKQGAGGLAIGSNYRAKESVLSSIAQIPEPLIGLEYVTEFLHIRPPRDPHYECKVCDLVLIGGNLGPHLLGYKHRLKYIQTYRPHLYRENIGMIWAGFKGEGEGDKEDEKARHAATMVKVKELAGQIEANEGRKIIQSRTLSGSIRPTQTKPGVRSLADNQSTVTDHSGPTPQPQRQVNGSSTNKTPPQAPNPSQLSDAILKKEYERRFGNDLKRAADQAALAGAPPEKKPFIPQKDKMQHLLSELSSTTICSEEDAALALQVSNNLTQALLSYRLNSFSAADIKGLIK